MDSSPPETLRPSLQELFADGLEAVAEAIDKVEGQVEKAHKNHLEALGRIFKEQEDSYDRQDKLFKTLGEINQGIGNIHRLLQIREEEDRTFREDITRRVKHLESKVPPNGAAHQ